MTAIPEKNWTILIYANGNNELEPEMHQAMLNAKNAGSTPDVNVLLQLGRADYQLVKLLRQDDMTKTNKSWTGVRRYVIAAGEYTQTSNLGGINMADPMRLYKFFKWGMQAYPAKRYMLILGGHGYQCVGAMTDYSQKAPYIMGIPEMTAAINRGGNELGRKIDILVLDICCFNYFEIINELGGVENHTVRNAFT